MNHLLGLYIREKYKGGAFEGGEVTSYRVHTLWNKNSTSYKMIKVIFKYVRNKKTFKGVAYLNMTSIIRYASNKLENL